MYKYFNKGISTPIAISIILILVILVGGFTWWQYSEIRKDEANIPEVKAPEIGAKDCVSDEVCVVFGEDGDCNCGCFNKNHNWEAEGACFCAAPSSCECVKGKCEGVFGEDEITDWKTLRNEDLGFEIKYPSGWEWRESLIYKKSEGKTGIELEKSETIFFCSIHLVRGIYSDKQGKELTFEELVAEEKNSLMKISEKEKIEINEEQVIIDKITGIKLSYLVSPELSNMKEGQRVYRIFIPLIENEIFQIGYYEKIGGHECEPTFNQMLSTFRTIEEGEVIDWNTYRNEDYGFEIKHPKDWIVEEANTDDAFLVSFANNKEENAIQKEEHCGLSVGIYENAQNWSLYEWAKRTYWANPEEIEEKITEINFNNQSAIKYQFISKMAGKETRILFYSPPVNSVTEREIVGIGTSYWSNEECQEIFDQILSTFKFLD